MEDWLQLASQHCGKRRIKFVLLDGGAMPPSFGANSMALEIQWKYSLIRRMFLFQSLSQVLSWLGCLALVWIFIGCLSLLSGGGFINIRYFLIALLGSLPPLYMTMPCILYVDGGTPRRVAANLEPVLWRLGYVISGMLREDGGRFISKLPRLLRWNENQIIVSSSARGVRIEAPKIVIGRIREKLEEQGH